MTAPFELSWLGGPAEAHYRKARPGIDDLPWGTLDVSGHRPEARWKACASWTDTAFTEYKGVVAFSEVLRALAEAQAPLDLLGMASGFVADALREARHPLTRAVLQRITADEALHYRLGGLYLEWAGEDMDDDERARLAAIALDTLRSIMSDGSSLSRALEEGASGTIVARIDESVVVPLARHGITIALSDVEALLPRRNVSTNPVI